MTNDWFEIAKSELHELEDKAAAFDWLSDNTHKEITINQDIHLDIDEVVITEFNDVMGYCGKGRDLLEAVQNAMANDNLDEMAAIGQEIDAMEKGND